MEDKITSLTCRYSTIEKLREFEIHPRETHEQIILRLIEFKKEKEENE